MSNLSEWKGQHYSTSTQIKFQTSQAVQIICTTVCCHEEGKIMSDSAQQYNDVTVKNKYWRTLCEQHHLAHAITVICTATHHTGYFQKVYLQVTTEKILSPNPYFQLKGP